jgi:hypothetical protein
VSLDECSDTDVDTTSKVDDEDSSRLVVYIRRSRDPLRNGRREIRGVAPFARRGKKENSVTNRAFPDAAREGLEGQSSYAYGSCHGRKFRYVIVTRHEHISCPPTLKNELSHVGAYAGQANSFGG